jgi:hypothetical protein
LTFPQIAERFAIVPWTPTLPYLQPTQANLSCCEPLPARTHQLKLCAGNWRYGCFVVSLCGVIRLARLTIHHCTLLNRTQQTRAGG